MVGIDANLREAEIELHRLSEKYLIVQKNPTLHKVYISLRPTDFILRYIEYLTSQIFGNDSEKSENCIHE